MSFNQTELNKLINLIPEKEDDVRLERGLEELYYGKVEIPNNSKKDTKNLKKFKNGNVKR